MSAWISFCLWLSIRYGFSFTFPPTHMATNGKGSNRLSLSVAEGHTHYVGFDLGTSGARMSIIERNPLETVEEIHSDSVSWSGDEPYDDPQAWIDAIESLLTNAHSRDLLGDVRAICVSGTSASCLLVDSELYGTPTRPARMYDYRVGSSSSSSAEKDNRHAVVRATELLENYAPEKHTARALTGTLAKLLLWNEERPIATTNEVLCHQADYCAMHLLNGPKRCGVGRTERRRLVVSDWHNCLKLGYDVRNLCWPEWLRSLFSSQNISETVLPSRVVSPGERIGAIHPGIAEKFGLPLDAVVVGGTTDSNAAFFAAAGGIDAPTGTAVTSLGSTVALKFLSETYLEDADRGVYSHRVPTPMGDGGGGSATSQRWLVGGASNSGCAVLRHEHFSTKELEELSAAIDPNVDSPLDYYPLVGTGERFPEADPHKAPILTPLPTPENNRTAYLHGILQGITVHVENEGYRVLGRLGARPSVPSVVYTCGGGSRNDAWLSMRRRLLDADDVRRADHTEASYGAAVLASSNLHIALETDN